MVIKTLRDAEVQIRKLIDDLAKVNRQSQTSVTVQTVGNPTVVAAELPSAVRILLAELDIVEDGQRMVHQALHDFRANITVPEITIRDTSRWGDGTYQLYYNAGDDSMNISRGVDILLNIIGAPTNEAYHDFTLYPYQDNTWDLGRTTETYKEGWINVINSVTVNCTDLIAGDEVSGTTVSCTNVVATGDVEGSTITSTSVTASLPAKFNASKELISGNIALGSEVSGTLPIANGGTGRTSFSALMPVITDGSGTLQHPATVYSGTIYVAASSGGAVTTAKNVSYGIIVS